MSGRFDRPSGNRYQPQRPADGLSKAGDTLSAANCPPSESGIYLSDRPHCLKMPSCRLSAPADTVSDGIYTLSNAADAPCDRACRALKRLKTVICEPGTRQPGPDVLNEAGGPAKPPPKVSAEGGAGCAATIAVAEHGVRRRNRANASREPPCRQCPVGGPDQPPRDGCRLGFNPDGSPRRRGR
jgi:hypothetical protein